MLVTFSGIDKSSGSSHQNINSCDILRSDTDSKSNVNDTAVNDYPISEKICITSNGVQEVTNLKRDPEQTNHSLQNNAIISKAIVESQKVTSAIMERENDNVYENEGNMPNMNTCNIDIEQNATKSMEANDSIAEKSEFANPATSMSNSISNSGRVQEYL